jgi:cold shock CspA family protein
MNSLSIPGATVSLYLNGQICDLEGEGYVGELSPRDYASIEVRVDEGYHIYGIAVDGEKGVSLRRDCLQEKELGATGKFYETTVPIKLDQQKTPYTEYAANHIRLVKCYKNGKFELWEFALISQWGHFFLTKQCTYEVYCQYDGKDFSCPYFSDFAHRWDQLMRFLEKIFRDDMGPVRSTMKCERQKSVMVSIEQFNELQAQVTWWNTAQGFGMVMTKQGPARIHWKNSHPRQKLVIFEPGQLVTFTAFRTPHASKVPAGHVAKERTTKFQREIVGVRPV